MMKNTVQDSCKTAGNFMQVFEGKFTFIQLAVNKYIIDQLLN